MRRVLTFMRRYRALLIGYFIAVVLDSVIVAIPPLLLRSLIDKAIPEHNRSLVALLAGAALAIALADAGLSLFQRWYSCTRSARASLHLRVALFDHVQACRSLSSHGHRPAHSNPA